MLWIFALTVALLIGLVVGFASYVFRNGVQMFFVGATLVGAVLAFGPLLGTWTLLAGYFGYGLSAGVVTPVVASVIAGRINMWT